MAGFDERCCGRTDHLTDGGGSKKPVPKTMPARTQTCARRRYYGNKNLLGQFTPYQRARARSSQVFAVRAGEDRRRAEAEHQEQAAHHEHRVHGRQGDLAEHGAGGVNYGHARV